MSVLGHVRDWRGAGRGVALATVVETWGSSPCPAGSQLAVADDGRFEGSVSGGCVEGAVVGTALAGDDGHRGWVHLLAVAPAHRRRGIGSALMRCVEAELAGRGCPKLNLQVRAGDPGAVRFYERIGFAVEDRVSMGKRLD